MIKNYDDIIRALHSMEDIKYRDFIMKLVPTIDKKSIMGVRMGDLRSLARDIIKSHEINVFECAKFYYREEKLLYALCMFKMSKGLDEALHKLDEFLPYINSWEVTDLIAGEVLFDASMSEIVFNKALDYANSCDEYTARLGLIIMLKKFNRAEYLPRILSSISSLKSNAYYVHIAAAWLLCELYFTDKLSVNEFLSCDEIDVEIKKMTQRKIRESMKKQF